jgi:hypothetical protein
MVRGAIVLAVSLLAASCDRNDFDQGSVEHATEAVRKMYLGKPGVTVSEINLIRESGMRISGFVRLKMDIGGEITVRCSATREQGSSRYILSCGGL